MSNGHTVPVVVSDLNLALELINVFYGAVLCYVFVIAVIFSSPGRSPGRAIVLPPVLALAAAALAKSLTLKFFM